MLITNSWLSGLMLAAAATATARSTSDHHKRNDCLTDSCSVALANNANAAANLCKSIDRGSQKLMPRNAEQTCSPSYVPYPQFASPCFEIAGDTSRIEAACHCLTASGASQASPFSNSGSGFGPGSAVPNSAAPLQSAVTTDIIYTTITVSAITNTIGSGRTSSLQVVDSTLTVTQTTTLTICSNCAVATNIKTETITAYVTAISTLSHAGNGGHGPFSQSHPVYHNSTGPLSIYATGSGASGQLKPTSGSGSSNTGSGNASGNGSNGNGSNGSSGNNGASRSNGSGNSSGSGSSPSHRGPVSSGAKAGSSVSGRSYHGVPFSSTAYGAPSAAPLSSVGASATGHPHLSYSASGRGNVGSSSAPFESGVSQSGHPTGTGSPYSHASLTASGRTNAPFPTSHSQSSGQGTPVGTGQGSATGSSGYPFSHQPSGSSRSILESGSVTKSNSAYPSSVFSYKKSTALPNTGSMPYSSGLTKSVSSSGSGLGLSSTKSITPSGTRSMPYSSGTGYSRSINPSGTALRSMPPSGISSRPTYASGSGFSSPVASNSGSKPYYPSSGIIPTSSGTGSKITYPFGSVTLTASRLSTSASRLLSSSGNSFTRISSGTGFSSYATISSSGPGPTKTGASSGLLPSGNSYTRASSGTGFSNPYYPTGPSSGFGPIKTGASTGLPFTTALNSPTSVSPSSSASAISSTGVVVPPVCVPPASFKLKVSGVDGYPNNNFLQVAGSDAGSDDHVVDYSAYQQMGSIFTLSGSTLMSSTNGDDVLANVHYSADNPTVVLFDTAEVVAEGGRSAPECRITNNELTCTAFTDLTFYNCPDEILHLSASSPGEDCSPLTIDVIATDGSALDTSGCVGSSSVVPSSTLPSTTASATSASLSTVPSVTACVPAPANSFILQVGGGSPFDGGFIELRPANNGEDNDVIQIEYSGFQDASPFSLAPGTGSIITQAGSSGLIEAGYIFAASDSLFRFDTAANVAGATATDNMPEEIDCTIDGGILQCNQDDTPENPYVCPGAPGLFISSGPPPNGCYSFTFIVLALDGSVYVPAADTCVSPITSGVTSVVPSVTLPPVVTSASATVPSVTPPPVSQGPFKLQYVGGTYNGYFLVLEPDEYNNDDVQATYEATAAIFTLDGTQLLTLSGTLYGGGNNEVANVQTGSPDTNFLFDLEGDVPAADQSTCIVNGENLECMTGVNNIFYTCDYSVLLMTGTYATFNNGDCNEVSLKIVYTT